MSFLSHYFQVEIIDRNVLIALNFNTFNCANKTCNRHSSGEYIDWGYYTEWEGNCEDCMSICDNNDTCEAVECGSGHCIWWTNNKCNDAHEFSKDISASSKTCIKIVNDKGRYYIELICK